LFNVQQTIDEGYIMAALIDYDCCLIKISENGEIEWEKEYNVIFFVQQTDDGGYIMTGQRGGDLCIIKTDAVGEEEWEKTYPVNGWESAGVKLQQTQDKGYIVLGVQWNDEKTYPRLIKTDEEGNIEWEKVFEEEVSGDILGGYALDQTSDGFIIAYYLSSSDMGKLIKTDNQGNKVWEKTFGLVYFDITDVQQTNDGGYIVTMTDDETTRVIKTDEGGNIMWEKIYDERYGYAVDETTDGGYIVVGGMESDTDIDFWLLKIENSAPSVPTIKGPARGEPQKEYQYRFVATDIDCDPIYYYIDWGDGNNSGWIGPYKSGTEITLNHSWNEKGKYTIKAKAKDEHNRESDWATLVVSMPKTFQFNLFIWENILKLLIKIISYMGAITW